MQRRLCSPRASLVFKTRHKTACLVNMPCGLKPSHGSQQDGERKTTLAYIPCRGSKLLFCMRTMTRGPPNKGPAIKDLPAHSGWHGDAESSLLDVLCAFWETVRLSPLKVWLWKGLVFLNEGFNFLLYKALKRTFYL